MNHRWKDNQCIHCGVKRKRKGWSQLMCIVNHPPWQVYKHGNDWWFSFDGFETGSFKRPECILRSENTKQQTKESEECER